MVPIVSRRRRPRARALASGPLVALGLLLMSAAPAQARSESPVPPPEPGELAPLTIEIETAPTAGVTVVRPAPGAETWEPCADQSDGATLRLCPAGQPAPTRLDDDALSPPAVSVSVHDSTEPLPPCGYAAAHNAEREAQARRARCAEFGARRLALAVLVVWYALGLLLAALFIIRRNQRRRDASDRDD